MQMTPTQVLITAKTKNCNLCRHDFARVLAKTRWNNRAVVVIVQGYFSSAVLYYAIAVCWCPRNHMYRTPNAISRTELGNSNKLRSDIEIVLHSNELCLSIGLLCFVVRSQKSGD